jgi:hypothetical protein
VRFGRRARKSGQDAADPGGGLAGPRFGRSRTPAGADGLPEPVVTTAQAKPSGARFPAEGRHRATGHSRRVPSGWPFTAGHTAAAARDDEVTPAAPPPGLGARGFGNSRFRPECA